MLRRSLFLPGLLSIGLITLANCRLAPPEPPSLTVAPTATASPRPAAPTAGTPTLTTTASAIVTQIPETTVLGTTVAPSADEPAQPSIQQQVGTLKKDDYQVNMQCMGEGTPTIVLDGSVDGASGIWERRTIPQRISAFTRVCSYIRSGKPRSPLTSERIAQDLHTVLHNTDIEPPYVLVAWSFASHNARLFAGQYPEEVVGMVLVDPAHPDQTARHLAVLPPEAAGEPKALTTLRQDLAGQTTEEHPELIDMFGVDAETSAAQARATGSLGDRPLVVLTATEVARWPGDVPADLRKQLNQAGWEMHEELAHLSSNSKHLAVKRSTHCIPCDQPAAVTEAIEQVVKAVQSGARIATE